MRNSLKSFIKNIVNDENLESIVVKETTKIDINIIKRLIVEVYKKYETYYEAENRIFDVIFSLKNIENLKDFEKAKAEELAEKVNDEILSEFFDLLNGDVITDIIYFLMKNKIKFFEKELKYKYDEIEADNETLRNIAEEAQSNATSSWICEKDENDLIFYNRIIEALNESMEYYLKNR